MADQILEVVDENDVVVRTESRNVIHKEGLLHREAHVWFVSPKKRKALDQHLGAKV